MYFQAFRGNGPGEALWNYLAAKSSYRSPISIFNSL